MNTSQAAPIRVAHLADLHIGSALYGLVDYPGAPAIDGREAPYEALRAAVRRIVEGGYDAVLIAGDVFDRRHCDARALAACQDALGAFHEAGLRTVVVSGNHDAESPLPHKLHLPPSVRWLGADAPESVTWPDLGITVHGQSVAEPDERRDLAAGFPPAIPGAVNIGLLHTSLHGAWSRRICAPADPRTLARAGYDYWALGHVHHRLVPGAGSFAAYPGNTHARGPAESGGRGFTELLIGDSLADPDPDQYRGPDLAPGSSGSGRRIRTLPVDTAPVRYETLHLPHRDTAEADLKDRFAAVPEPSGGGAVVWTLSSATAPGLLHEARALAGPAAMVCPAEGLPTAC
ncbi:metallophosphoesterase family protein [Streptomyces sp. NBC_01264]|uniref:metallophosphoesterase family protein n=1 Tax=Streptomyces sp. NBC_01264 TaxID=2903804 RepID=UPI00225562E8|nr:DNA repair exonuclease [Streptomyces sp. NBC_01264]MCX4782597.1 DNA repair exonuclease [Streptomyces sp. NBC_01264]